jgi:hypothetical protein
MQGQVIEGSRIAWTPRENSPNKLENKYVDSFKPLLQRKSLIKQRMAERHEENSEIAPWESPNYASQRSIVTKPNLVNQIVESPNGGNT